MPSRRNGSKAARRCDTAIEQRSAVGYIRVSTEEQVLGGVSLDAQRAKIADYCALHELGLDRVLADEGRSGKRADNRPGLSEAIEWACRE